MRAGHFAPEECDIHSRSAAAWRRHFTADLPALVRREREALTTAATEKLVLRSHDGLEFECVRLPMGRGRETLCISSQVGCGRACKFCETARMGLLRNLEAREIVGQVVKARQLGIAARSVVFMGMGEPLDNLDALEQALRILMDRRGLAYSQSHLTICTVGHAAGILRLRELGWKRLNLSLSLNAPDDDLRRELMPITREFGLAEVHDALRAYRSRANFQLGINYCLLPGINDAPEHAAGIARFAAGLGRVMVYLIPYNPGTHPMTRAPTQSEVDRFVGWLREEGLPVRRRVVKGRDLMAACGQLGNLALRPGRRAGAAIR